MLARIARARFPGAEHDLVPRLDVGGHGAEWDRQLVEATDSGDVLRQAGQFQIQLLALYVAERQLEFAGFISQLLLDQVKVVVALAAKLSLRSRRLILEHVIPVHVPDLALDLFRAEARTIQSADNGAHAGSCNAVNRNVHLLQHLQHTYVRGAPCAAAAQHQADPGTALRLRPALVAGCGKRGVRAQRGPQRQYCDPIQASGHHVTLHYLFSLCMNATLIAFYAKHPAGLPDPALEILGPVRRPRTRLDETAALQSEGKG